MANGTWPSEFPSQNGKKENKLHPAIFQEYPPQEHPPQGHSLYGRYPGNQRPPVLQVDLPKHHLGGLFDAKLNYLQDKLGYLYNAFLIDRQDEIVKLEKKLKNADNQFLESPCSRHLLSAESSYCDDDPVDRLANLRTILRTYDEALEREKSLSSLSCLEKIYYENLEAKSHCEDSFPVGKPKISKDGPLRYQMRNTRGSGSVGAHCDFQLGPLIGISRLPFRFLSKIKGPLRLLLLILLIRPNGAQALGNHKNEGTLPHRPDLPLPITNMLRGYPFIIICAGILAISWVMITHMKAKATHVTGVLMFIWSMACSITQVDDTTSPVQKWS